MTNFDAKTLRELQAVQEPRIRTDRHPRSAVVIWVMVDGNDVFVPGGQRLVRCKRGRDRVLLGLRRHGWRRGRSGAQAGNRPRQGQRGR